MKRDAATGQHRRELSIRGRFHRKHKPFKFIQTPFQSWWSLPEVGSPIKDVVVVVVVIRREGLGEESSWCWTVIIRDGTAEFMVETQRAAKCPFVISSNVRRRRRRPAMATGETEGIRGVRIVPMQRRCCDQLASTANLFVGISLLARFGCWQYQTEVYPSCCVFSRHVVQRCRENH